MKKFTLITCVLLAALTTNAASLNWGTTGLGTPIQNAAGVGLTSGYDVLLVWDTTGDGLGLTKDIDTGVVSFGTNVEIKEVKAIGATAGRTGQTVVSDDDWPFGGSINNLYIVAFDGADWTQASNFAEAYRAVQTFPAAATPAPVPPVFALATSAQRIVSGDWGAIETVPEPTSLALLALGAAAVVLRRRMLRK